MLAGLLSRPRSLLLLLISVRPPPPSQAGQSLPPELRLDLSLERERERVRGGRTPPPVSPVRVRHRPAVVDGDVVGAPSEQPGVAQCVLSLHQDGDVSHLPHLAPPLPGWCGGSVACNEESHHTIDSSDYSHHHQPSHGLWGWRAGEGTKYIIVAHFQIYFFISKIILI